MTATVHSRGVEMAKQPKPMSFGIGGEIPEHAVGSILAAMVRAGVDWKSLNCVPIIPPPEIEAAAVTNGKAKTLALPAPKKRNQHAKNSAAGYAAKIITKAGKDGISRGKLITKVLKKFPELKSPTTVDQAVSKLVTQGVVLRAGQGFYKAASPAPAKAKSHAKAKTVAVKNGKSHGKMSLVRNKPGKRAIDIVLNALTVAHPQPVDRPTIRAALVANDFAPGSIDGAIGKLKTLGRAVGSGDGTYTLSQSASEAAAAAN